MPQDTTATSREQLIALLNEDLQREFTPVKSLSTP
jgi:hypothetical protein